MFITIKTIDTFAAPYDFRRYPRSFFYPFLTCSGPAAYFSTFAAPYDFRRYPRSFFLPFSDLLGICSLLFGAAHLWSETNFFRDLNSCGLHSQASYNPTNTVITLLSLIREHARISELLGKIGTYQKEYRDLIRDLLGKLDIYHS